MRNIELKARLRDLAAARQTCETISAKHRGELRQTDTYFRVQSGRLKLRENVPGNVELIFYHRADTPDSKSSNYVIVPGSAALREVLARTLGVRTVVRKTRDLWMWQNVRIHLDTVEGLGAFIEFEAVLGGAYDDKDGHAKIAALRDDFGITDSDLIACSYLELLDGARP